MSFAFRTSAHVRTALRINPNSMCAGTLFILAFVIGCSSSSTGGTKTPQVTAPSIATQPLAESVGVGESATFSVSASGRGPLTYQWLRGGAPVASANGTSYTTPALALSDDGSLFSVTVSNSTGSVTSSRAKVSVSTKAPMIVTNPTSTSTADGASANFSVVVSGTGPFSYQWLRGSTAIPGAIASSYTLPAVSLADTGSIFSVQVSNTAGSATSSPATLTVTAKPFSFTAQPGGVTQFAVGKTPGIYLKYNDLGTVANTGVGGVGLCSDGCTYTGATGMQVSGRITRPNANTTHAIDNSVLTVSTATGKNLWTPSRRPGSGLSDLSVTRTQSKYGNSL